MWNGSELWSFFVLSTSARPLSLGLQGLQGLQLGMLFLIVLSGLSSIFCELSFTSSSSSSQPPSSFARGELLLAERRKRESERGALLRFSSSALSTFLPSSSSAAAAAPLGYFFLFKVLVGTRAPGAAFSISSSSPFSLFILPCSSHVCRLPTYFFSFLFFSFPSSSSSLLSLALRGCLGNSNFQRLFFFLSLPPPPSCT